MKSNEIYILMNKPCGYVCSAVSDSHKVVYSLLPQELQEKVQNEKRGHRLHTIGRLDCDTSGLLLLTTDGQFSHDLQFNQNNVEKCYQVELETFVTKNQIDFYKKTFSSGMILPSEKKAPEQKILPSKIMFCNFTEDGSSKNCFVKITEGKFHQVRRMFLKVGNKVVSLKRVSFGHYRLPDNLEEGKYIFLT